MMRHLWFYIKR